MYCEYERVIDGIYRFVNSEMYSGMASWQKVMFKVMATRFSNAQIKEKIINNTFAKMLNVVNEDGLIDVCGLAKDLKKEIESVGNITLDIPLFGNITLKSNDIDVLYRNITGEELTNESY